ncbi:cancer-associated 1 protein-like isoform X2, partial [Clarias magur]
RLWKETINTLKGGICSLIEVYNALIQPKKDPVTGQWSNIGKHIVQAHKHLQHSEEMANLALKRLDAIKYIEKTIEELGKKKLSNERKLSDSEKDLEQNRKDQTSINQKIQGEKEKKDAAKRILDNGQLISGVGTGLLAVPVLGWIA